MRNHEQAVVRNRKAWMGYEVFAGHFYAPVPSFESDLH